MRIRLIFTLALGLISINAMGAAKKPHKTIRISVFSEQQKEAELKKKLCSDEELECDYVNSLFSDPRFALTVPPPSTPPPPPVGTPEPKDRERNPYLAKRFGLLTPESLERCRGVVENHTIAFDAAYQIYRVPREVICGHLRIETDFGIATPKTQHPLGTGPAFNRLVTLYVRKSSHKRQKFALVQLTDLIRAAHANHWDLLSIPGSSTGAIGLLQFEPENFYIAVDGNGDGIIDFFNLDDAILSLAHYLALHGYNNNPERAIYSYYGKDPHKYYMKAVLAYATAESAYLKDRPIEEKLDLPQFPEVENQVSPSK